MLSLGIKYSVLYLICDVKLLCVRRKTAIVTIHLKDKQTKKQTDTTPPPFFFVSVS